MYQPIPFFSNNDKTDRANNKVNKTSNFDISDAFLIAYK